MVIRSTLILVVAALVMPSAFVPAQFPQSDVCRSGCYGEYRAQLERCGTGIASGPCIRAAALAYRSCLSICPRP
jgi:hypothetical protein